MVLGPGSRGLVGNKTINFSFWASFFGSFFGRAKNEQRTVGKLKNRSPKIICSLDFSLVTFFVSRQRK